MILNGYTSLTLSEIVNNFIVNVSLSNSGGEFNNAKLFRFGKIIVSNAKILLFIIDTPGVVTNIKSYIINCSAIGVFWDDPANLHTIEAVPIAYYNLNISVDDNLWDVVSVNDTNYQFKDSELFLHRYMYVITAVNELGEGLSNSETFSYQRGSIIFYI